MRKLSSHDREHRPTRGTWARLLLIAPFIGMLWVSSYNTMDPSIGGVPFFYWYQLLWVVVSAAIVAVVYLVER